MPMITFSTYKQLATLVDECEGVVSCQMTSLKEAHGVGRLGPHVATNISEQLAKRGLAHYPEELPVSQGDTVRIYRVGTPVGDLIRAVLSLDPEDNSDERLRTLATGGHADKIKKIREIVCD